LTAERRECGDGSDADSGEPVGKCLEIEVAPPAER
jgi:hypothetical protein